MNLTHSGSVDFTSPLLWLGLGVVLTAMRPLRVFLGWELVEVPWEGELVKRLFDPNKESLSVRDSEAVGVSEGVGEGRGDTSAFGKCVWEGGVW